MQEKQAEADRRMLELEAEKRREAEEKRIEAIKKEDYCEKVRRTMELNE